MTRHPLVADLTRFFGKRSTTAVPPSRADTIGQRLAKFRCYDFELYIDPADRTVQPIIAVGQYEPHIMTAFLDAVKAGSRVLDIGANMGMYAVAAARRGARVTAIDAGMENCKLLLLNAELNNVQIEILPFAVSDTTGMCLFPRSDDSNKTIRSDKLSADTFDAYDAAFAAPLDAIIGPERVDVVKIDIEGREYAALKDAHGLFAHRPVFFIEYCPPMCEHGSGAPGSELLKLFTSRGYTITFLGMRVPSRYLGSDIAEVDRIAQQELDAGITIIDLMMTP